MEKKAKVSIIVPVYKCEQYIEKCICSVIDQKYSSMELLLVLDGEFDRSGEICRFYEEKYEWIHVISKINEGVSAARNTGIDVSNGTWIMFLDSDDWLEDSCIETLAGEINDSIDIIICDYFLDYKDTSKKEKFFRKKRYEFKKEDMQELIINCILPCGFGNTGSATNVGVPWAKLYRKAFIERYNVRFVPGLRRMQDMVFNLYAFTMTDRVLYLDKFLYHYTKNEGASTVSCRTDFIDIVFDINRAVKEFIYETESSYLDEVMYNKNILLILEIIKLQYVSDESKTYWQKRKEIKNMLKYDLFTKSLNNYSSKYLNNKTRIAAILLKHHLFALIYIYVYLKWNRDRKKLIIRDT